MSRITIDYSVDLKTKEVEQLVGNAILQGLRDTIVAIHRDAVKLSPYLTGHNRRSIASEVSRMGTVEMGEDAQPEKIVDDSLDEAACYSTSGYGGYLETGTVKMAAQPYIRPAFDMHRDELITNIKKHMEEE